jgi:hypothetical protein
MKLLLVIRDCQFNNKIQIPRLIVDYFTQLIDIKHLNRKERITPVIPSPHETTEDH